MCDKLERKESRMWLDRRRGDDKSDSRQNWSKAACPVLCSCMTDRVWGKKISKIYTKKEYTLKKSVQCLAF